MMKKGGSTISLAMKVFREAGFQDSGDLKIFFPVSAIYSMIFSDLAAEDRERQQGGGPIFGMI
jgi:hypothetical protein